MIYFQDATLIIRSMFESDIEALYEGFYNQNWNKPLLQFKEYYAQQNNNEKKVIIAEYKGKVAGYALLVPEATSGPFAYQKIPEFVDFNVFILFRQLGIGHAIMNVAENLAREYSTILTLSVGLYTDYGIAQRLYAKRGYLPDGSGLWYHGKNLAPHTPCVNDDDLVIYWMKELQ